MADEEYDDDDFEDYGEDDFEDEGDEDAAAATAAAVI